MGDFIGGARQLILNFLEHGTTIKQKAETAQYKRCPASRGVFSSDVLTPVHKGLSAF
jgi:hypothetical protein